MKKQAALLALVLASFTGGGCAAKPTRLRKVVEVADLAAAAQVPLESGAGLKMEWKTIMTERTMAEGEIFRMMEVHTNMSMSLSFPPTGPTPVQPTPTEPTPVQPTPTEPTPTEPTEGIPPPTAPKPVELTPTAPTTVGVTTTAPTAVELTPTAPTPEEPTPTVASPTAPAFVPIDIKVPVELPSTEAPAASQPLVEPTAAPVVSSERGQAIMAKCGVTPLERSASLETMISEYSDLKEVHAAEALDWLDNADPAIICPSSTKRVEQRFRVVLLYYSLGGPAWANCGADSEACVNDKDSVFRPPITWLDVKNECVWFGLRCLGVGVNDTDVSVEDHYELAVIELPDNNLAGNMPSEIYEFTELRVLVMDGNLEIEGQIESNIGKLSFLEVLDLDSNKLTGSIPNEIYGLTKMFAIDLNNNQLTGTLSSEIANLSELNVLQLEFNQMKGPLPTSSLYLLENLVALTINNNDFTGDVNEICDVRDTRREGFDIYLEYFHVDCRGDPPKVACSCCVCP